MALDNFGLAGAALNFGTSFVGSMVQNMQTASMNRALADTYRTQSRLALISAANQNRYSNLELSDTIFNIREQANELKAMQITGISSSGFSTSTGDKRLMAETERKAQEMMDSQNRQAFLDSYERYRQAYLNDIQYKAQAKIADINAKYASGWRGVLSATSNSVLSALGGYFQFAQPTGKINNVGYGENVGFTNKLDYSGKVNLGGLPKMF